MLKFDDVSICSLERGKNNFTEGKFCWIQIKK